MSDFLATLPSPLSQRAHDFFALWDASRAGRTLPLRRDIAPEVLGQLLETCVLLELRGHDEIRISFAGNTITAHLGFDLTGFNYLDLTSAENRRWRAHLTMAQAAQPCGVVIYYWLRFADGSVLPVEFCGAPYVEDEDAAASTLILCCATGLAKAFAGKAVEGQPVDPDSYEEGDGMRFIDLGYGVPPLVPAERQAARPVQ